MSASGNNVLKVSIDDPTAFEAAADKYLMGGKEGVAGQTPIDGIALTNSEGQIIHTFTNDKAIKQYANSLDNTSGNFLDVVGNISTATGVLSDIFDVSGISKVSQVTGAIKMAYDLKQAKENPTVNTISDVVIDGIGFIPNGGAEASYVLSETKEVVKEVYEMEKEYQKQEIIDNFTPPERKDPSHMMEKAIRQEIKQLFRGK